MGGGGFRRDRARVRQLQTQQQQQHQHQRKLGFKEIIVNDATTTTIETVASVIDCQEIFVPPSPQPPNVDVCYRVTFTVTIQSSTESSSDSQLTLDGYFSAISISVNQGWFTMDLDYLVVEEGSTDLTGVPTSSPTSTPTMAPVVPTTPVPTNVPTNVPTKAPTEEPTKPPTQAPFTPTETIRWTSYVQLTAAQVDLVRALDYTKATWNLLGTNEIEFLAFFSLTPAEQAASEQLGMDEEDWDCYQNHYSDYSWDELLEYELAKYWMALGWTRMSWEGDGSPPNTNDMFWMELTPSQQDALTEICYRQESWDGIPIPEWK